jgi:hypothetical protein
MATVTQPRPSDQPDQDSPEYPTPSLALGPNQPYQHQKRAKRLVDNKLCTICGMSYRYRNPHYKKYHPETLNPEHSDAEADGGLVQYDAGVSSAKKPMRKTGRHNAGASNNDADRMLSDTTRIAAQHTSLEATHAPDPADDDPVIVDGNGDGDDAESQESPVVAAAAPAPAAAAKGAPLRKSSGPLESQGTFCVPCGRLIERAKWSAHQRAHTLSTTVLSKFYAGDTNGDDHAGMQEDDEEEVEDQEEVTEQPPSGGATRKAARNARTRIRGTWRETAGWAYDDATAAAEAGHERGASNNSNRSAGRGRGRARARDSFVMVNDDEPRISEDPPREVHRVASWERLLERIREAPELSRAQKRDLVYKVFEGRALNPSSARRQRGGSSSVWAVENGDDDQRERGRKRSASGMLDDDDDSVDSLRNRFVLE